MRFLLAFDSWAVAVRGAASARPPDVCRTNRDLGPAAPMRRYFTAASRPANVHRNPNRRVGGTGWVRERVIRAREPAQCLREAIWDPEHAGVIMRAGDFFCVPPGHDSWVVGEDRYVSLNILGSETYAAS
jgi:hypothetical protein